MGKVVTVHAIEGTSRRGSVTPLFLNIDSRWV
jgi:hypothetical protein